MKILYGVVGEGMGHAIRSRVVLEHLLAQGHEVEIMASSRAADFLGVRFAQVHRIHGLHIIYDENRVRTGKTLFSDVLAGAVALPGQIRSYYELVDDFAPEVVQKLGMPCRIYGMRREIKAEPVEGNLAYRPFDEAAFIADLASARAVIAGGRFMVMSECVYLHKPRLSIAVRGQIEQVVNAHYLAHEGYGRTAEHIDDAVLADFLSALPSCEAKLANYSQDGNRVLERALNGYLHRLAAGLS